MLNRNPSPKLLTGVSLLSSERWDAVAQSQVGPEVLELSILSGALDSQSNFGTKVIAAGSFWYLLGEEDLDRSERLDVIQEYCRKTLAVACVIKLPPVNRFDSDLAHNVLQFQLQWNRSPICPLYFEPGKEGPPPWIDPTFCVSDPIWNPRTSVSDYWKIHGWNKERWVRTYPKEVLVSLVRKAERFLPRFLILGHSQRRVQYPTLKGLFKKGDSVKIST